MSTGRKLSGLALAFMVVSGLAAQEPQDPSTAPPVAPSATPPAAAPERPVNWLKLVPNVFHDQVKIYSFPAKLKHRRVWLPTLAVAGVTAALLATDPHTGGYFRSTTAFNGNINRVFTGNATLAGIYITPASFYLLGLARGDSYAQHTALLAAEAVVDTEILTTVMKDIGNRARPAEYPGGMVLSDTWFNNQGPHKWITGAGSFPSGHAIAAFSLATVMSRRYPHQRWLPYVAYGLASMVGFSRMTLSAHFPSDVFVGGVLGYAVSRFIVLRQ